MDIDVAALAVRLQRLEDLEGIGRGADLGDQAGRHVVMDMSPLEHRYDDGIRPELVDQPAHRPGRLLQALGVRQETSGAAQGAGVLYVCNHVSWLDIIAINAAAPVHFVSKSDVKAWPVVGRLVSAAGTLFIERESRRDAMRVVHQVADALRSGDRIAFFPEGTTSDGRGLLPFHANLLQAAISSACPVQAMAICYADAWESPSSSAAYIGDDTLIQSIWAIARAPCRRQRRMKASRVIPGRRRAR